jgi:AbrB family looped-hinge helix DNA binding protein
MLQWKKERSTMPIAAITSKGRITIPKAIRDSMALKPTDRIALVMEGNHVILYPLRGTILDAAASIQRRAGKRALNFRALRNEMRRRISKRAVNRGR